MTAARGRRLGRAFFAGDTTRLARALLGCVLVHEADGARCAGRIVETEAYLSEADEASHSRRGPTARNAAMFGRPGTAYVYRIYGLHRCFNVVGAREGVGEAVLVRALEPLEGLDHMRARRGRDAARELCSGPAKLVQALGIGPEHDGADLLDGALRVRGGERVEDARVLVGPRVGIRRDAELPLRFRVAGCPFVSRG